MDEMDVRKEARKAVTPGSGRFDPTKIVVESDARVIRLDDPDSPGYAVEAWIYLMERKTD